MELETYNPFEVGDSVRRHNDNKDPEFGNVVELMDGEVRVYWPKRKRRTWFKACNLRK